MYLSYAEYEEYGGTMDEASFLPLAFEAESRIDWYTFKRLRKFYDKGLPIPFEVKMCEMFLINLIKTKMDLLTPQNSNGGINANAQVMAQANDGVSVEYSVLHADEIYYNSKKEIDEAITRYLDGVLDSLGRPILYRGLYPDE